MQWRPRVGGVALAVIGVGLVTACDVGGGSTVNQPSTPEASTSASPAAAVAHVGATLTLNGTSAGEKVQVALVKMVDPAQSGNQFLIPAAGMREVAVELRYKNVGSITYSQSVLGDVTVMDQASHAYSSDFENTSTGTFPGLPGFPLGLVNIAPGESADGFVTFQIPQGTPVTQVKLTVDLFGSAIGADTGEWLVP